MDAAIVAAVAAVVTVPIGLIQWHSAREQARSAEVGLLREMRSDWLALKPQWHRAILTAICPDSYYSPADGEIRSTFRKLVADIAAEPKPGDPAWFAWHQETRDRSHEFEQAERDVLFFLATLASAVFRGRLSPDLAYTVVGLDVVRRSRQVRVLLGEAPAEWAYESDEEKEANAAEVAAMSDQEILESVMSAAQGEAEAEPKKCPWCYWVDSLPGLTDRILGLLDILWAEGARRYDMQTHDLVAAAELKRISGSGLRNRLRVRRLAKEHGSHLTSSRLEKRLLAAEFIRIGPPRKFNFPSLEFVPPDARGWGARGRLRRLRHFLAGRLRRSRGGVTVSTPYEPWELEDAEGREATDELLDDD
jgi:hypothetical protein